MGIAGTAGHSNRQELVGTFGMVASTHWLASGAGMAVLERGGNAFDAAAAVGFVLQVVEPNLNGLGGEVPIIAYSARDAAPFVICGQGQSPGSATPAHFASLGLDLVPGSGLLAACVPGAFGAWLELLGRWGTWSLADVLEYAIDYAEGGYPIGRSAVETIQAVDELFRFHWPTSAAVYLRHGRPLAPGDRFTNPDLARTYGRLASVARAAGQDRLEGIEAARRAFYEGFVAEAFASYFDAAAVMDTSGEPHSGLLGYEDFGAYHARVEDPLTFDYHGYTVCKTGPWGQGPVFAQQLALLSGFDLSAMDPDGPDFVHTIVECAKLAFADREAFYGDPDFADVPIAQLLSPSYNDARRKLVGPEASTELRPGTIPGFAGRLPSPTAGGGGGGGGGGGAWRAGSGEPSVSTDGRVIGDTCHLDVVDRYGNMVSATPSGGWLQSAPVVPGLGFAPTTRAQMFWIEEGLPNSLAGGKRPRTTLTPTLVLKDGAPVLAFGTPGGDSQDQWSMALFLRHVHHGLDLQEAVESPAFHSTHFPSSFYPRAAFPAQLQIEDRFAEPVLDELSRRGHRLVVNGPWSLGHIAAVGIRRDGFYVGAASQRGMQNYAIGR